MVSSSSCWEGFIYGNVHANRVTGFMDFGRFKYTDESGYDIDNQVLVFRVEF